MSSVPRRWIVYRNDEEQTRPPGHHEVRHLICEACGGETECGLRIGDNRPQGHSPIQRWYTVRTFNYRLPACGECMQNRTWKELRGYRLRRAS